MRSNGTSSAFETRSQISRDSVSVSSPVILPTFLTATNAAGARSPPNVIASPGTRQVITQRSGLPKRAAASFDSSASSALPPSAGLAADVNTWISGMASSDRLCVSRCYARLGARGNPDRTIRLPVVSAAKENEGVRRAGVLRGAHEEPDRGDSGAGHGGRLWAFRRRHAQDRRRQDAVRARDDHREEPREFQPDVARA